SGSGAGSHPLLLTGEVRHKGTAAVWSDPRGTVAIPGGYVDAEKATRAGTRSRGGAEIVRLTFSRRLFRQRGRRKGYSPDRSYLRGTRIRGAVPGIGAASSRPTRASSRRWGLLR